MKTLTFSLSDEQTVKVSDWLAAQRESDWAKQKAACQDCASGGKCWRHVRGPYYGAIGGAWTYSFTPTSLGTVVKITHAGTGQELDVSDYEDW